MQKVITQIFDTIGHVLSGQMVTPTAREQARSRWGELRGIFTVLAGAAEHMGKGLGSPAQIMLGSALGRLEKFDGDTAHLLPPVETPEYQVDPGRFGLVRDRVLPMTGLYIRAKMDGRLGNYDSMTLDGPSFAAWVQSYGPIPQFVLDLLFHTYRHDPFEEPGANDLEGG